MDYERLDAKNRTWSGKKWENLDNYTIYGKKAIAAADGKVVKVIDGLPEQVPGVFPSNISPEEADGNSVILDLGGGNYALYARFQPGKLGINIGLTLRTAFWFLEKLTIAYHLTGLLGSAERSHEHYAHRISVRDQAATLSEAGRAT